MTPKYAKVEVDEIREYEERGLALLEQHRKDFIGVFNKPVEWFFNHKFKDYTHQHADGKYVFKPSGNPDCKILAVAHLDTVIDPKKDGFSWNNGLDEHGLRTIVTPTVDDRLGLAMIMFLFNDIDMDWLFTEGEENSKSTGKGWKHPNGKQYNWLVEFDRGGSALSGGNDAVTYMYKRDSWHEALESIGIREIGYGSYTDICYLQQLEAKAFNLGIGYHDNHDRKAWFRVGEWMRSVELFRAFYDKHKDTRFEHKPVVPKTTTYGRYDWNDESHFIGYKTSRYQQGDVVMTSLHGRWDKTPQIGELFSNPRSYFWMIMDERGYIVDVVSGANHIVKHMKCPNCNHVVSHVWDEGPRWSLYKDEHVFCGECWADCHGYSEIVLDAMIHGHTIVVDGFIGKIEALDDEGALIDHGGDMVMIDASDMARAERYVYELGKDRLVIVNDVYLDLNSIRHTYLVLDTKDDQVYIRQANLEDGPTWIVPSHIMMPVSINEIEA